MLDDSAEEVLVVVGGGALLELLVEDAGIRGLAVELEGGTGPLLVLPIGSGCVAELVTVGLGTIIVGLEGPTVEALLITGIGIDVVVVAILVVGPSVDVAIAELVTGLMVE
jgi:hypothetical protein